MSEGRVKLRLGENHRRVVSVLLRNIEKAADGITTWLERKPGLLHHYRDDFTAAQKSRLREMATQLHAEIRRFYDEVELDCAMQSRRRAIAALISSATIDLEEVNSQSLRGYGEVPEEIGHELDAKLERLLRCLEQVRTILDGE
jgi:hypothetical protein